MFKNFPDSSRVWIFGLKQELSPSQEETLKTSFSSFVSEWLSHKNEVSGDFSILYSRFLIFVADNDLTHVSGCSIDSLFRQVKEMASSLELDLASVLDIFYRDSKGEIVVTSMKGLKEAHSAEKINSETIVFQNAVQSLGELRDGVWECSLAKSKINL